jgi:hypothetical protein
MAAVDAITGGVNDIKSRQFAYNSPEKAWANFECLVGGDVTVVGKAKFKTVPATLHFVKSASFDL